MPGAARVGVELQQRGGVVVVAGVMPDSPAAMLIAKGEVLLAVNDTQVGDDAKMAQRCIVTAITSQSTPSGRLVPVRLTVGSLEMSSPKGIDDLQLLDLRLEADDKEEPTFDPKRMAPLGVSEVVQAL